MLGSDLIMICIQQTCGTILPKSVNCLLGSRSNRKVRIHETRNVKGNLGVSVPSVPVIVSAPDFEDAFIPNSRDQVLATNPRKPGFSSSEPEAPSEAGDREGEVKG
ncbi:hypothetical protein TcG_10282 [Trypanosoma cruzi]|nr:hypothetical protein TcG_10282 [Trypanosoma cruzi]